MGANCDDGSLGGGRDLAPVPLALRRALPEDPLPSARWRMPPAVRGSVLGAWALALWLAALATGAGFSDVRDVGIDHPFWRFYRLSI